MLRIVFFGLEIEILKELKDCSEIVGVYAPSFKASQRKIKSLLYIANRMRVFFEPALFFIKQHRFFRKQLRFSSSDEVADFISQHQLKPIYSKSSVNNPKFLQMVADLHPDLGVVANFGHIIGRDLLNIPVHGFINFHPTLLPKYRGPTPFGHILLNNETHSGATWHIMTEKIDSGDILAQERFTINENDTERDLAKKSVELGKSMLCPLLKLIEDCKCAAIQQNESEATYYDRLTPFEEKHLREIERIRMARKANSW